jgi:hypothetical protein
LVALNPVDKMLYKYQDGNFEKYTPLTKDIEKMTDFERLFENSTEMSAFKIEDATQENLPVYHLN